MAHNLTAMKPRLMIFFSVVAAVGVLSIMRPHIRVSALEAKLTPDEAIADADLIVAGQFVRPRSRIDVSDDRSLVFTDWRFEPTTVFKGSAPKRLTISVPGGSSPVAVVTFEGAEQVQVGREAIVYLKYVPERDRWVPLSMTQGLFTRTGEGPFTNRAGEAQTVQALQDAITSARAEVSP